MLHDLRISIRQLLRKPGFTLAMIATLMLGIGANSAIFSLINAVLLKPLPYPHPERLVTIWGQVERPDFRRLRASEGELLDYQANFKSFDAVAGYATRDANLTFGQQPERVSVFYTTSEFWQVLGVEPLLGRLYVKADDLPSSEPVVILSHGLWQRAFGSDPDIVGKKVELNLHPQTVIGVMRPGFAFPRKADLWAPMGLDPAHLQWRQEHYLDVVARLKPGVSIPQARSELRAQTRLWPKVYAPTYPVDGGWDTDVTSLLDEQVGDVRPALFTLLGAVGFVLLITCANVGSMLLVRVESRSREILVRSALGAGRSTLIRQFSLESMVLALTGGVLGLFAASWAIHAVVARYPEAIPRAEDVGLDWRVVAFTLGLTLLTGFLVSLIPAWYGARPDLSQALKDSGGATTGSAAKLRSQRALVVVEIALSVTLLIGAGLLIRSFFRLQQEAVGFKADRVLTMQIALPRTRYPDGTQVNAFFSELARRLQSGHGVEVAGAVSHLPLAGTNITSTVSAEGRATVAGRPQPEASVRSITPGYIETLGIPLRSGRLFTQGDDAQGNRVAIVDQRLAETLWPGVDPIGRRVRLGPPDVPPELMNEYPWRTVVGVVGAVRHEGPSVPPNDQGTIYFPLAQQPERALYLALRSSSGDPTRLARAVRQEVQAIDRDEPVADIMTMDQRLGRVLARQRLSALLLAGFGGLALLLAALGIYAVITQTVARRTREIGIRMALGADRASIQGLMAKRGLTLVGVGVVLGLGLGLAVSRLISRLLYGVHASDPATFVGVAVLLFAVAVFAVLWPARRASRLHPMTAFRQE